MFTIARTKKPDWDAIEAEYIAGGISQRELAKKHGVSFSTLKDRANRNAWAALRTETQNKAVQKAQQAAAKKTADAAAQNAVKLEKAREKLIDHLLRQIDSMPKNGGTHTRQSQTDKATGRQMTIDYDLQTMINALEKLSNGSTADIERQKRFMEENNAVMVTYADLFSRPARTRKIEELEAGGGDV